MEENYEQPNNYRNKYVVDSTRVTYFAKTDTRSSAKPFGIKPMDRMRHIYVIGKTGMGKSTLLENLAAQDLRNGEGICFIDPHGGTADLLMEFVPKDRLDDVLYFAPFDMDYPISFNVMEDVGFDKRHLVVSGLMAAFKKIWADQWSSRMEYILTNTLLALLEYPDATMLSVNRMYTDKDFRNKVVNNVSDPLVKSFWVDEYAKYTDRYTQEATPAIQNKVGQFTGNPLVRNIVGQPKSTFDFREMMDNRKIVIVNLSKGKVGEVNANLLGSMIITKVYLAAMSRADADPTELKKLPNFYFYVDEFQSFANESFADILSEARKYKLNLTMAHQYIEQMSEEVRAAVFGNVGTMIAFRVGAYDAEVLEKEFAPQFTAQDLVNLGFAQIYLKLMIDGIGSQPFSAQTLPPIEPSEESHFAQAVARSRAQFAYPRAEVEKRISDEYVQTAGSNAENKTKDRDKKPSDKASDKPVGRPLTDFITKPKSNVVLSDKTDKQTPLAYKEQRKNVENKESKEELAIREPYLPKDTGNNVPKNRRPPNIPMLDGHENLKSVLTSVMQSSNEARTAQTTDVSSAPPAIASKQEHIMERQKQKTARKQNRPPSENRNALKALIESKLAKVAPKSQENSNDVEQKHNTESEQKAQQAQTRISQTSQSSIPPAKEQKEPIKEIPEDILKKILE